MKIKEVIERLEAFAPAELAEEWDNVGLMLGDGSTECTGILLALDVTSEAIAQAKREGCNLIVSHHPLIFFPLKRLDLSEYKAREIKELIESGINVYSMHTNLDKTEGGINSELCRLLGAKQAKSDGVGAIFEIEPMRLADFAKKVAKALNDNSVRIVGDPDKTVRRIYVVGGSGGSEYGRARECADVLLTGDLKHHNYIDALEDGFPLVEFSHYCSEIIMQGILEKQLCKSDIKIIKAKSCRPFRLLEEI